MVFLYGHRLALVDTVTKYRWLVNRVTVIVIAASTSTSRYFEYSPADSGIYRNTKIDFQ